MRLRLIFGACGEVHVDDIAFQGRRASIDSPILLAFDVKAKPALETYSSSASHGAQEAIVYLYDLLNSLAGDPISRCSS